MSSQTINEDLELRNKKRRKNRKALKRLAFLVKLILTAGLLVATVVLLALSPLFNVNRISVTGAVHYTDESLQSLSGAVIGENGFKQTGSGLGNILKLRMGNAEKAIIENCPYIKSVKVRYMPPGTIRIEVDERKAEAAVSYAGTSLLVDREGYVLDTLSQDKTPKLPYIRGLKFSSYKEGEKPAYENPDAIRTAFRVLDEIRTIDDGDDYKLYTSVDSINVADPNGIVMSLESRLKVNLGDIQDLNYRLSATKTIFEKNIKKNDKGVLDFTSGENPVFTPESEG